jgi:hypothetical protein
MIDIITTVLRVVLVSAMEHIGVGPVLIAAFWLIRIGLAGSRASR